jgi:UDP-N-acetylmuramyl pentapeptide phosphotransferase/UDP-N-acetylglucosamine-1-phosphate transferase
MGCGYLFIPAIIKFCKKKGLYDLPNSRKVHKNAIPRLGGLSFLPSMLLASLIVMVIYNVQNEGDQIQISLWSVGFFTSLAVIYTVGIVDDLVGLGARTKFVAQIIAAAIMPLSGLYVNSLYGFLGIGDVPFWVGAPLTVFVVVFMCNAINLIDGIDGLSGGLSFIALSGFLSCFMQEELWLYSILIAGLMGVLIAFLYFNVFGSAEKEHKIFMGDSGSLTLGFILGFLAVKLTAINPHVMCFRPDALMQAYSFVVVPVFDVVRVSLVRIHHKQHIFRADKNHIHHKLMRTGLTQHQVLTAILVLAVGYILLNVVLWQLCEDMTIVVAADVVAWMLFHYAVNRAIRKNGQVVYLENKEE